MIGFGLPSDGAYTRAGILASAPNASGVYALFINATRYIYIGEAKDIQARLLEHLGGDNVCITRNQPTHFAYDLVPASQRVARQDELIAMCGTMAPAGCNQRFG